MIMNTVIHPIPPVFDRNSKILILGSFPSVKSREGHFFYHHPQNRFWKTLAGVLDVPVPDTIAEKKAFLLSHRIALWDVIASCSIEGSSDSSIHDNKGTTSVILSTADIRAIFLPGRLGIIIANIRKRRIPSVSCRPRVRRMRRGRSKN